MGASGGSGVIVPEHGRGDKAPILLVVGGADRCGNLAGPRLIKLPSTLIIGRERSRGGAPANQLAFDDKLVSRAHLRVSRRGGGCIVEDAGSVNGTFLDGRQLTEPTRLSDGSILFFGGHAAVFRRVDGDALRALEVETVAPFGPVPTSSPELAFMLTRLRHLAPSATEMLLVGEAGVGKEVYARAVHQASGRTGRFVAIDCAAITPGLIEEAHGGTLFLDKIGDVAPPLQAQLLRFIEQRVVHGRAVPRPVDVRIVAATTPSGLSQLRADLVGRLGAEPFEVPPLRERIEDLGALIAHFVAGRKLQFEPAAFRALCLYEWPHNVRQVMNVVDELIAGGDGEPVGLSDLARLMPRQSLAPKKRATVIT